jgi:CheY-like chemotaxis protein
MANIATQAVTNEAAEQQHPPLHVLIIEDYADGRETLRLFLELCGYWVDTACNGNEGLDKALGLRPQVALIDIGLPGLDGFEVARRVRATLGTSIRLAACTAYGQPEDRAAALAAGFDLFFVKPVDIDALLEWLESQTDGALAGNQAN